MNTILWWAAENTATVAILLPIVALLCKCMPSRPAVQHLLWLLLLAKLVTPPVVAWPWSPRALLSAWPTHETTRHAEVPPVEAPLTQRASSEFDGTFEPAVEGFYVVETSPVREATVEEPLEPVRLEPAQEPRWSWFPWILTGWAGGAGIMVALAGRALWKQSRLLRGAAAPSAILIAALAEAAERLRMKGLPIAVSDRVLSPLICCLGRARLVWPKAMDDPERIAGSDAILAHELAHVARRDHLIVYFEFAVLAVHWWNPVAWYLRRMLAETRELACDALALDGAEQPRGEYAQRLLDLTVASPHAMPLAPAFGAGMFSRRFLQRRLTMVFDTRTNGRVSTAGALLTGLLAAAALPGFSWAQSAASNEAPITTVQVEAKLDDKPPAPTESTTSETTIEVPVLSEVPIVSELFAVKRTEPAVAQNQGGGTIETKPAPVQGEAVQQIYIPDGAVLRLTRDAKTNRLTLTVQQENRTAQIIELGVIQQENVMGEGAEWVIRGRRQAESENKPAVVDWSPQAGPQARWSFKQTEPAPQPVNAASHEDVELLQSDVELAEVNLQEKKAELELAQEAGLPVAKRRLAELAIRRAEIELKRCVLKLKLAKAPAEESPAVRP